MSCSQSDSPGPLPARGRWIAQDLSLLPRDGNLYEVFDGSLSLIYGNDRAHFDAVWSLTMLLAPFVWKSGLDIVLGPLPFRFSENCEVQPDIVVLPKAEAVDAQSPTPRRPPELIIEVATPYSARADYFTKRALYMRRRVKTYWILDLLKREMTVWSSTNRKVARFSDAVVWWPLAARNALHIDLTALFAGLPAFQYR